MAQAQAQPAAEAAAPTSEEVAAPSPRQQRYEAATAELGGLIVFGNVDYSGLTPAEPELPVPAADRPSTAVGRSQDIAEVWTVPSASTPAPAPPRERYVLEAPPTPVAVAVVLPGVALPLTLTLTLTLT